MNRFLGTMITIAWLAAMAALVKRDVLPFWMADEAPLRVLPEEARQIAILNSSGGRIGTNWITTMVAPAATGIQSSTVLDVSKATGLLPGVGAMLIETDSSFGEQDRLEQFHLRLVGIGMPAEVQLDRYGEDFACTAKLGSMTRVFSLDGRLSEYLGDSLRPFVHLAGLRVGQQWRVRLLDPFSLVHGSAPEFKTQLATVTRRETIRDGAGEVDCFRVEMEGAVAWAAPDGRIVRQEADVPLLGRWVMVDEPYDKAARNKALATFKRKRSHSRQEAEATAPIAAPRKD
jgi:hypothetical protein